MEMHLFTISHCNAETTAVLAAYLGANFAET